MRKSDIRKSQYFKLNSFIATMSTQYLTEQLKAQKETSGWGKNSVLNLKGTKVFVKRIPLSKPEQKNLYATKNLFRLPLYYNYGIGSAGFGAFRELVSHIKTSNWVLSGECPHFPILYHYRVIPRIPSKSSKKKSGYFERWGHNKRIIEYIRAREEAEHEIVLFLEHFPATAKNWLPKNLAKLKNFSDQTLSAISFMKAKRFIHFDMHLQNILVDGSSPIITDFGLALDLAFDLTKKEQQFFREHVNYDYAEFIGSIGMLVDEKFGHFSETKKQRIYSRTPLSADSSWRERLDHFLSNPSLLSTEFGYKKPFVDYVKTHHKLMIYTNEFFFKVISQKKKSGHFDSGRVGRWISSSAKLPCLG